ncbi:hypothetical protein DRP04_07995 [Archaeoglobales archaeon]|nr:MAG: hypothetical protein DRP04_07995 [Archaeoglobales archaeon]
MEGGQRLQRLNVLDVGLGRPQTPLEKESLLIPHRNVIKGSLGEAGCPALTDGVVNVSVIVFLLIG